MLRSGTVKIFNIKKGYSIPLKGEAQKTIVNYQPKEALISPQDFYGIKPKLDVALNDSVKAGTVLFHDKKHPEVKFTSPASGTISEIQYGPRRSIELIKVRISGDDAVQFPIFRINEIPSIKREDLIDHLLSSGLWPLIRQRPFDLFADPGIQPSSIFVNCMDTAPLAADPEFTLQGKLPEFQAGMEALKILGKVHLVLPAAKTESMFAKIEGVNKYAFSGKHPAGLVGTHIAAIDPVNTHKRVWYLNARDVASIGSFLLVGQYPSEKIIAVAGSGLTEPLYIKTISGADVEGLTSNRIKQGEMRIISGNILTGRNTSNTGHLGFYDNLITVIPEGRERHFIGWMLPGFNKPTFSRAFASRLIPGRKYSMNTNQNGEPRAFVKTGDYEKVMAIDVYPDYISKAVLSGDIDMMEKLGILECSPEDVALCSYICPSKIEFTDIFQKGLDMLQKEIN